MSVKASIFLDHETQSWQESARDCVVEAPDGAVLVSWEGRSCSITLMPGCSERIKNTVLVFMTLTYGVALLPAEELANRLDYELSKPPRLPRG
jgi:hypothetical protein